MKRRRRRVRSSYIEIEKAIDQVQDEIVAWPDGQNCVGVIIARLITWHRCGKRGTKGGAAALAFAGERVVE